MINALENFILPPELEDIIYKCKSVIVPQSKNSLYQFIFGNEYIDEIDVYYKIGDKKVPEATVTRCKNGAVVNYCEDYMRRRDPNCMYISDDKPTDKPLFSEAFGYDFSELQEDTFSWLKKQELIIVPFRVGSLEYGYDTLLVCPRNAAFFAFALSQLQFFLPPQSISKFKPRAIVYVAPPFRHTHFKGKQVCVHNRLDDCHEIYAYNLYPGPSAKKGIYSVLLDIGEQEGWVTAHASACTVITPYENTLVMMHEGASGGGKSELLQDVRREIDGRVLVGVNTLTGESTHITMSDTCTLMPITDDIAMCHPKFQSDSGKLALYDGEAGWFLRVDGITEYGSDPLYERISLHSKEPLVFFNLQAVPQSTCLLWEHTLDSTGEPCPNPRVIIPREMVSNIVSEYAEVDVRSFGVRMPPSYSAKVDYGIMGLMQIVPPALAWLWRLVAPRGFKNPSINSGSALVSEGVGSYWPFATGKRVKQANLLLEQILNTPNTKYILLPNQHIGVYKVGFSPEWISREYLARRGGVNMKMDRLTPARCPLMGYSLNEMKLDGQKIRSKFLHPEVQDTLGLDGYDKGAKILYDFFAQELALFDVEDLHPIGKEILEVFKNNGTVKDYEAIIPMGLPR